MSLAQFLEDHVAKTLAAYEVHEDRIREDARAEEAQLSGGYGHRQVFELIQNGADAIKVEKLSGRVELILAEDTLYCANEGQAVTEGGVRALLMANMSEKEGDEIGRFGLGFKSVLGICEHPEVFSSSVSFRFNPPDCAERMRKLVGDDCALPRLRTASLLDVDQELAADPTLRDLLGWATTVVRLRLTPGCRDRVLSDLRSFPAEFLVFSPHVGQLTMRAVVENWERSLRAKRRGDHVRLMDGYERVSWKVFQATIMAKRLAVDVRRDMDARLQLRERLPLTWAVPVDSSKRQQGCLWAFFPTQTGTSLQGILNAPWKTHSDRETLLDGPFNRALINCAAQLVASHVGKLNRARDPSRFLDVLPARDASNWADLHLGEILYALLRQMPCLPSARGTYAMPAALSLRPSIAKEPPLEKWFGEQGHLESEAMVHRTAELRERAGRAKRLGCREIDLRTWIENHLVKATAVHSIAAIRLVGTLIRSERLQEGERKSLRELRFVLSHSDELVTPNGGLAFRDGDFEALAEPVRLVHEAVAADADARAILTDYFGIALVSKEGVFRAFLQSNRYRTDWDRFWELSRTLDTETADRAIRSQWTSRTLEAKTLAGPFRPLDRVLLTGEVITSPVSESFWPIAVDPIYHAPDQALLKAFRATDVPLRCEGLAGEIYSAYDDWATKMFREKCSGHQRPQANCLQFTWDIVVAPLDPLIHLSGDTAVRMSRRLLPYAVNEPNWTMKHRSRPKAYPTMPLPSLTVWALRGHGWLTTSQGSQRIKDAIGPDLRACAAFLPVAECSSSEAELLAIPNSLESLSVEHWRSGCSKARSFEGNSYDLTAFYAMVARAGKYRPISMRCQKGDVWDLSNWRSIYVTADPAEADLLRRVGSRVLVSDNAEDVLTLVETWGLQRPEQHKVGYIPQSDPQPLFDRFPGLRGFCNVEANILLRPCEALWFETRSEAGMVQHAVDCTFRDGCFFFTREDKAADLLDRIVASLGLQLSYEDRAQILRDADRQALGARRQSIRECTTLEDKLLAAIGVESLRAGIPERHVQWLISQDEPSDLDFARLALAVHGIEVLKMYQDALASNGFQPPSHWAGGDRAVAFVRDLGFPEEYAGFTGQSRRVWDDVRGPVTLPDLHDYQDRMKEEIKSLLRECDAKRGILSLPTGAGKTRVAVQSIIEWIKDQDIDGRILWIAQSDELCEQCVESWLQAWRALGPTDSPLRVNRLWGATNEGVRPPESGSCLVVATFHSLANRLDRPDMEWVFSPHVVVIDEAHGATAPTYTRILGRLGLDQRETARPLIGLTATPFRGDGDGRETMRLAFRFEHRRFDKGFAEAPMLYQQLQDRGILAHADHDILEGESMELSADEMEHIERFSELPDSAAARLGGNELRNRRILDHIAGQPVDWPILLFSASKDHAEDLAVRLSMQGISAAAVTGDSSTTRRRHTIAAFKRGDLRVLTNYGVLTTGFDAPSVRALYVTRPIFSPVLYQQIIGRGLRGPKNGGKDRCQIVNVADNIAQFGQQLAFHRFESLWRR